VGERETIALNRRARHDYDILDTCQAGIVLTGTEIKSVRAHRVDLRDSYAQVERGEMWLHDMHIAPYEAGSRDNPPSRRTRKLLLHRREINRLLGRSLEKGLTIIPLRVYLERGFAKVELGLGRGRRQYDKRQAIAAREQRREEERALSRQQRDQSL
jgi:SsrA-binding protein